MTGYRGFDSEELAVECWCRFTVVHVRPEEIRAGRTASCGKRNCSEEAFTKSQARRRQVA